jgi:hypothetical protein
MRLGKIISGLALSGSVVALGAAQFFGSAQGIGVISAAQAKLPTAVPLSASPLTSERRLQPATLEQAKHAAFQGGKATLNFMDGALGNAERIRVRANQLLDAIAEDARFQNAAARETALQSVRDAVDAAIQTSYIAPAIVEKDFVPDAYGMAWDVGGQSQERASLGYGRIAADSPRSHGISVHSVFHNGATGALSDSLANIRSLDLPLQDGDYQLILLTNSQTAQGTFAPFGKQVALAGEVQRTVGVGGLDKSAYLHLAGRAIVTKSGALASGLESRDAVGSPAYMAAARRGSTAVAMSLPAHVENGKLQIDFVPAKGSDTLISSVVAVRADYRALQNQVDMKIAALTPENAQFAYLDGTGALDAINAANARKARKTSAGKSAHHHAAKSGKQLARADAPGFNALVPAAGGPRRSGSGVPRLGPNEKALSMTLNSVTKERAIDGLMAGTTAGMALTQAYLDQSGGDTLRLQNRALSLLDGLTTTQIAGDFVTLADATNKITEATEKAAAAGYYMNYKLRGFRLGRNAFGVDYGPGNKSTYGGFKRITQNSAGVISGPRLETIDRGMKKVGIANDAIKGATSVKVNAPDGLYKVYLLAPVDYAQPFGAATSLNGQNLRLVDLRDPTRPPVWKMMTDTSIKAKGGLESIISGLDTEPQIQAARRGEHVPIKIGSSDFDVVAGSHYCLMLATRARVKNGEMTFDFDPGALGPTALAALVAEPDDIDSLRRALADKIASQLASLAPAAGRGINSPVAFNNLSSPISQIGPRGPRGPRGGIPTLSPTSGPGGGTQQPAALPVTPVPTEITPPIVPVTPVPPTTPPGGPVTPPVVPPPGPPVVPPPIVPPPGPPVVPPPVVPPPGPPIAPPPVVPGPPVVPPPAGQTITIRADAGIDCNIELGDILMFDGTASAFTGAGFDPALLKIEWILQGDMDMILANGFGLDFLKTGKFATGPGTKFDKAGRYQILLRLTYGALTSTDIKIINIVDRAVDEPGTFGLLGLGLAGMWWRKRKTAKAKK